MSFPVQLAPSPVAAAFSGIEFDPLDKFRLTQHEKSLLRSAEANPIDYTLSDEKDSSEYARVLLKVLAETSGPSGPSSKVSRLKEPLSDAEALQMLYVDAIGVVTHYAIAKLYDVISCLLEKKEGAAVTVLTTFYNDFDGTIIEEWRHLLRILHLGGSGDDFAQRGAALCLAYILMAGCRSQANANSVRKSNYASVEEPLRALVSWVASQLQSSASASISLATPTLTALMSCIEARVLFAQTGGIGYLSRHLRVKPASAAVAKGKKAKDAGASVQQLYDLTFSLWNMTYECNTSYAVRSAFAREGVVRSLVDLVSSAPREKVIRVALSALRNLATTSANASSDPAGKNVIDSSFFLNEMIGCGLLKSIDYLTDRQWSDPDIVEDLNALSKLLHENYKDMSRWDVYKAEVESGHLEWGILHTEKFFKENAKRIEGPDGDFHLLKVLIALVSSHDEDVSAIACFDIGEFVRFYPNGRAIAKRLGAKEIVMPLIEHDNAEVQRHALQCMSKLMVQNWAAVH